jgi:hypothetical protein
LSYVTVENTLSEKVSEVSTQISDSDMPKNMEDQIIYTAEPIESDIQASHKTTEISPETIGTKTNASSYFSDCQLAFHFSLILSYFVPFSLE